MVDPTPLDTERIQASRQVMPPHPLRRSAEDPPRRHPEQPAPQRRAIAQAPFDPVRGRHVDIRA